MTAAVERQRVDVWLWRARFVRTRAAAARLIAEGGVRLVHAGLVRRLERPAAWVEPGDALGVPIAGKIRFVRVEKLGVRRGPPAEARALYAELPEEPLSLA